MKTPCGHKTRPILQAFPLELLIFDGAIIIRWTQNLDAELGRRIIIARKFQGKRRAVTALVLVGGFGKIIERVFRTRY